MMKLLKRIHNALILGVNQANNVVSSNEGAGLSSSAPLEAENRFGWVKVLLAFIAGGLITPFLSKLGEYGAARILEMGDTVRIEACLPLKEARTIISEKLEYGDVTIADEPTEFMNETSVFVRNETGKTLKNAVLSIYAVGSRESKPGLLFTRMLASSFKGSAAYKVKRTGSSLQITIPVFNQSDFITVYSNFAVPIGYIVEIFGEDYSYKDDFVPGCAKGSYAPPTSGREFFSFTSDRCVLDTKNKTTNCRLSTSIPFNITDEMRGKKLLIRDKVIKD